MVSKTTTGADAPGSARVLVIGSGGREYTIVETLLRSQSVAHVFVAPGNAGTSLVGSTLLCSFPYRPVGTLSYPRSSHPRRCPHA
jgi:hypothetical protein